MSGLGGEIYRQFTIVNVIAARMKQEAADALAKNIKVRYVESDGPVYALSQTVPWGIDRVFGDESYPFDTWDITRGDKIGIAVAVIDTGIDGGHEDLHYNVAGGVRFRTTGPFLRQDDNYDDDNGHGTHVAGTIAALDNVLGVVGVGPEIALYAVKVLDASGSGSVSSVVAGIEWSVDQGIPVLNMSLGSSMHSQTLQDACDFADSDGHLLVAAAGNSGNSDGTGDNVGYPAKYDSVVAVAASDSNDKRASFSSTGPAVELIAPGVSIYSTLPGSYGTYSGTSMASPHVAGVAALVWAADSNLYNTDVRSILQETAEDLELTLYHQGHGLVRADLAVRDVADVEPPPTGNIEGTVKDGDEVGIVGATVVVEGTNLSATTGTNGYYLLEDVPAGEQENTASADGYYSKKATVNVVEDDTVTQDFVLEKITEEQQKMHVNSIDMWDKAAGPNRFVSTKVEILSSDGTAVSGATVYLETTLPDDSKVSASGDTAADGTITFETRSRQTGDYTSTVINVEKDAWEYDSSVNVETSESIDVQ